MRQSEIDVVRIAMIGPESSGKTTMCRALARHYNTVYANEYVRGNLRRGKKVETPEDLYLIACKQLEIEHRQLKKARRFLFCDTELINLKIWSQTAFGSCDPRLMELALSHTYDHYLLFRPDLVWSDDGIRHCRDLRSTLFEAYLRELKELGVEYLEVNGLGSNRFNDTVSILDKIYDS